MTKFWSAPAFQLSSSQIGLVTALGEVGRIISLLGLSFYGELSHRPRWIALSAFIVILSYILLDIPDLFTPDTAWKDLEKNEICVPSSADSNVSVPLTKCAAFKDRYGWRAAGITVFAISHILSGCASAIPIAYGVAVIQDHFVRKDSALYLGIHFAAKVLGPVFGFLLGSLCTAMLINRPGTCFFSCFLSSNKSGR